MTLLTTNSKKSLKKNGHFALGEWFSFFFGHFIFFFHFNRCASYDPPSLLHLSSVSGPSLCIISVFLFTCVQFNPQARSHSYRPSCNSCTHSHANLIVVTTCPLLCFRSFLPLFQRFSPAVGNAAFAIVTVSALSLMHARRPLQFSMH